MKKIYFTPGPTELYPAVKDAIEDALGNHICSVNHRSSEFIEIYRKADSELRKLLGIPRRYRIMFLSSATECMDRLVQNCVESRSHHFVNGAFSERFYKTSLELGRNASSSIAEHGNGFSEMHLENGLDDAEMICVTMNETSTGVAIPEAEVSRLKEANPDALLAADVVTAVPYVRPDFSKIDAAFFSVQKGFGMPAGLGVLIAGERVLEKAASLKSKGVSLGSYHNLLTLAEYADKFQNPETPNVLSIYLIGRVAEYLNSYGIERTISETESKSEKLYAAIEESKRLEALVRNEKFRSNTVIVAKAGDGQSEVKQRLLEAGYVIGSGYGKYKDTEIRIANFPMHKPEDADEIAGVLRSMK